MSLIEAVTTVASENGYVTDTKVITSVDTTTKQLLAMAQRIIREMGTAYPWSRLYKQASVTLVAGQNTYPLPSDFSYYHHDSFWSSSKHWPMYGPLSPSEYGDIQGYGLTAAPYSQFQIRGVSDNRLFVYPTPSASGDVVIYQYFSKRYVRPLTWAAGIIVTLGSYISYNGNYYTAGSAGTTGATAPTVTSGSVSDGAITWTYYGGTYSKFLADTDEPVFSQKVFEQGLAERFAEIKRLEMASRFQDQLNEEYSRDIPGKTIYAGSDLPGYVLQARSGTVLFGRGF